MDPGLQESALACCRRAGLLDERLQLLWVWGKAGTMARVRRDVDGSIQTLRRAYQTTQFEAWRAALSLRTATSHNLCSRSSRSRWVVEGKSMLWW